MKENEFDIQVRNLLQNAQESVSPSVWEGVQAGLARKRRAAAFWRWTGAVAAAAAILTGVVLLWPATEPAPSTSTLVAATSPETVQVTPPAGETLAVEMPVADDPVRLTQQVAAPQPVTEEARQEMLPVQESTPATVEEATRDVTPAAEQNERRVAAAPESAASDQSLFNRLAYEEHKSYSGKGWSLSVGGNLEDKRRGDASAVAPHYYSAPPLDATEGIYNESPEVRFSLPFSVGVGLNWQFARHWAVGTGIRYTNLSRTFVADYVGDGFRYTQTDIDNHQHWLGIPLNVYFVFVDSGRWRVHTFAGGGVDFLLDNDYRVHGVQQHDIHYHLKGTRPQFSAGLGLGVEFKITPWMGLYLDPSFRYYFRPDLQPRSLRTIQPFRFDLEVGLRFNLGK